MSVEGEQLYIRGRQELDTVPTFYEAVLALVPVPVGVGG
jgi:hypothetical protein